MSLSKQTIKREGDGMIDDALIEQAAHRFALLADPTRLRILRALVDGGEMNVSAVADAAHTSSFNASQHLSRLSAAGMVDRRREGSRVYYRPSDSTLPALCDLVCSSLRNQAAAVLAGQPGAGAEAR